MQNRNRETGINVKLTEEEKVCIERVSEAQGMTVSDYVRAAAMITGMLDGDRGAYAIAGKAMKARFGYRWKQLVEKCNVVM